MPAADAAIAATQSPLHTHPLCRRYLVTHLLTLPIRVKRDSDVRDQAAWWSSAFSQTVSANYSTYGLSQQRARCDGIRFLKVSRPVGSRQSGSLRATNRPI